MGFDCGEGGGRWWFWTDGMLGVRGGARAWIVMKGEGMVTWGFGIGLFRIGLAGHLPAP